MKYENQENYIFEIPPVENSLFYVWRIIAKILSFMIFGIGCILLSIFVLPFMKIIFTDKKSFKKHGRLMISNLFKFFIGIMTFLGVLKFQIDKKDFLKNLKSCILVSNHPSLLDVVMIISRIPNADCIVNSSLKKNVVSRIIANFYITNDVEHSELIQRCKSSIEEGNVLVIFPEGTRTKIDGQNQFKKGAARIALAANCPIVPVFQGGNDKLGLRKKDSLFLFNHTQRYHYTFYVKDTIYIDEFKNLSETVASKRIMQKVHEALSYENNWPNITGKNPLLNKYDV